MTRNTLRIITTAFLILSLVFGKSAGLVVFASEGDGEPAQLEPVEEVDTLELGEEGQEQEPEEEEPSLSNEANIENDVETVSDTGENDIETVNVCSDEEINDEELVEEDLELKLNGCEEEVEGEELVEEIDEELQTEDQPDEEESEQVQDDEETIEEPESVIDTGDAVTIVNVENEINTTEVDSTVQLHTLNIFVPGDIEVAFDPQKIANEVFSDDYDQGVVNVAIYEGGNYAVLENNIESAAITGNNSIEDSQDASITTGDAYSLVNLLNKVNTTIIGSTLHIVSINIYGDVEGNVILPEGYSDGTESSCCTQDLSVVNVATVTNNVVSESNTGENSIALADENGEAEINTGDAGSVVNVFNLVNKTLIGVDFFALYINDFGNWVGEFLGWNDILSLLASSEITSSTGLADCDGCVGDINQSNEAVVTNNIMSRADTGGNSIEGGSGNISTGNSFSTVNLINIINSTIINSRGFIGFINIFGSLTGDIGGVSKFEIVEEDTEALVESTQTQESSQDSGGQMEEGGYLEVYQYNNVNDHVYPGDTVMFFVDVKNPGSGKVYNSTLVIDLYLDGIAVGGAEFLLGDIGAHKSFKISTGLVLSDQAQGGEYTAHAYVIGNVGPENSEITAYANSLFNVIGYYALGNSDEDGLVAGASASELPVSPVGGQAYSSGLTTKEKQMYALLALLMVYMSSHFIYRRRVQIAHTFPKITETLKPSYWL